MNVNVLSLDGEAENQIELPEVFGEETRPDIIKRAVLSAQSSRIQPKGSYSKAGMETSAETPSKGSGRTRVRRVKGRGYHAAGRSAWAPFTKGGREAHPPKEEKEREESINNKEKNLAVRSAISATQNKEVYFLGGMRQIGIESLPLVIEDEFEGIEKTREVKEVLENLGVWPDVERVKNGRNTRAGRGKSRGRRYKEKVGPLIVVGEDRGIFRGARNIPGVDVVLVGEIDAEILAPGGSPARLTLWTESAIEEMDRRFSN